MAGPVGRLGRRRYEGLQVAVVLQADHVEQVARLEPGEADLDPAGRRGADEHDPAALGRALVHEQAGRPVPLDDRPGNPADLGPDPVDDRRARLPAADNCVIALPERGGRNRAAAPGFRRGGERKALFAALGEQNQNVRANVEDSSGNGVYERSARGSADASSLGYACNV